MTRSHAELSELRAGMTRSYAELSERRAGGTLVRPHVRERRADLGVVGPPPGGDGVGFLLSGRTVNGKSSNGDL